MDTEIGRKCGLDLFTAGQEPVAGYCKHIT